MRKILPLVLIAFGSCVGPVDEPNAMTGSGGTKGSGGSTGSGGSGSGGSGSGGSGSGGVSPLCTSGKMWTGGDEGIDMRPGENCGTCHIKEKPFTIAGTVYPTATDPNDCFGTAAGGIQVVITDADGKETTLTPSAISGNFTSTAKIKTPYSAKLTNSEGLVRAMIESQTVPYCNSCHTPEGANGAPGRIIAPD